MSRIKTIVPVLKFPFSMLCVGPSGSGKSTLVSKIIDNSRDIVEGLGHEPFPGFDCIIIIYRSWQTLYNHLAQNHSVLFYENSLPAPLEVILREQKAQRCLLVFDDALNSTRKTCDTDSLAIDLFTRLKHHLNVSVIYLTQNLFEKANDVLRILNRNSDYLVIFKYPRDQTLIRYVVHQCQPDKQKAREIIKMYHYETSEPHSYVLFDYRQNTPDPLRFKSSLFCERDPFPVAHAFASQVGKLTSV